MLKNTDIRILNWWWVCDWPVWFTDFLFGHENIEKQLQMLHGLGPYWSPPVFVSSNYEGYVTVIESQVRWNCEFCWFLKAENPHPCGRLCLTWLFVHYFGVLILSILCHFFGSWAELLLTEAQCVLHGESSSCKQRIDWTQARFNGQKRMGRSLSLSLSPTYLKRRWNL